MRDMFAKTVTELSDLYPDLVMLAGDIGNKLFDGLKLKHPNRFFNCGVAEANMTGVAAGLASSGMRPITYTITPFNTVRCLEQIRLDICYPNLPVIIVGTGAGLSYGGLGATHHSMEDIAILRTLPNMNVICPADPTEVKFALTQALKMDAPTYIRLGKKGEPVIHKDEPPFEIGKGICIRDGKDIALISVGNVLGVTLEVSDQLGSGGISSQVISLHTVKPLDHLLLNNIFEEKKLIIIIEEHGLIGGASSAILEWGCDHRMDLSKVIRFGGPDKFLFGCGDQQNARKIIGLTPENITTKILDRLNQICI